MTSVPWFLAVLVCLLRWIYAPHQLRYAYWAAFLFGLCITLHQSLIVAALGIEVAIAAGNPRLGRDAFLGNFIIYLADYVILAVTGDHMFHNIGAKPGLLFLFNAIGIGSLVASIWLAVRTKGLGTYWKPVLIMAGLWMLGVSFYLYMAVAGMTNPPMQWGYPRTVEGFFHAISRGQYEQPNPTNLITEPGRFLSQLGMLIEGAADEFTWVYLFIALVPFVFFFKMQKRERAWLIALTAMYLCLGGLLIILLNPTPGQGLGRPHQGLPVLVPHDRGLPDRLRPGPDGRVHGHPLPEVPALGPGGRHRRGRAGPVLPLGCHRQALLWPRRRGQPLRAAALDRPGLCAESIRPAHLSPTCCWWPSRWRSSSRWWSIASAARCSSRWASLPPCRFTPAWPTGSTATSATTGSATGSAMTCSPRRSRARTANPSIRR